MEWTGSAMDEEVIYVVDEVKGALSEYDSERDCWKKVIELPELKMAEQIAAGRRVCVVCGNGEKIVVVDVMATPARVWVVEPPPGQQVVSVHILPRMSKHHGRRGEANKLRVKSHWVEGCLALKLKGIQYEFIEEDLFNKSTLLLQHNPIYKKVPVLIHNGKPIVESLIILQYIEETWKQNPILPADPYEKAMSNFWANFGDDKVLPSIWYAFIKKGKKQEEAITEAWENLKFLEEELRGKKFFGGENIGLVDIASGWLAITMKTLPIKALYFFNTTPYKKIPVLVHNGRPIVESLIILEYIDETWKQNPLLPEDPHKRATARFWAKFGDDKAMSSLWPILTKQGKEREEALVQATENLKFLEEELKGKRFFGGEEIGFVDIALGWLANLVLVVEEILGFKVIDKAGFPFLSE
ncbi:hypothetical protein GH714_021314 [Hevea brasiliensis]|uniref:glutathione transferase n=1 Tax=Hevea brasiliensis TaxID=3981 RepID=A0A6A6M3B8_HEVBR|nr:hypothetical protein GH714_021314 [Hevea brasiliensis]